MKMKIKQAINAIENIPSGNAGIETFLQYQCTVLHPASKDLQDLLARVLNREECQRLVFMIIAYVEALESHEKVCQVLEHVFGAEFNCSEVEEHKKDLDLIKSIQNKLQKLADAEHAEELLATSTSK